MNHTKKQLNFALMAVLGSASGLAVSTTLNTSFIREEDPFNKKALVGNGFDVDSYGGHNDCALGKVLIGMANKGSSACNINAGAVTYSAPKTVADKQVLVNALETLVDDDKKVARGITKMGHRRTDMNAGTGVTHEIGAGKVAKGGNKTNQRPGIVVN